MTGKTNVHYDDTLVSATVTITLQETLPLGRWAREKLGQDSKLSLRGIPRDQAWTKLLDLLHDEIEGEFMCAFAAHWEGDYTIRDADEKLRSPRLASSAHCPRSKRPLLCSVWSWRLPTWSNWT